jgi:hypothetical protein
VIFLFVYLQFKEIEKQNQQLYKQQLIEQGKQVEEEKKEEKPRYRGSDAGSFTSTDFTPKPAEVIPWKGISLWICIRFL